MSIGRKSGSKIVSVVVFLILILLSFGSLYAAEIHYRYDSMGRVIEAEYEDGTVIQYIYDRLGNRLEQRVTQGSPSTFLLAASKTGTGSGNVTGTGISCSGNTCTGTYAPNTSVTLTATADASSTFSGWSGCDNTVGNQCTVTMNANRSVSASFTSATNQRTLIVNELGTGSGTVSGQGLTCVGRTCTGTYAPNTGVTLTAVANTGSTFSGWSGCDSVNGAQCTVAMNADRTVGATFTSTPSQCTLTVNMLGTGSGAVSSTGLSCRGDICTGTYARGAEVRLTATPSIGSTFAGWLGDVSVDGNQCSVIMDVNKTVISTFDLIFSDVPSGYWAANYIVAIYNAGITVGCAQDNPNTPQNERRYCPEDSVTRGQMAAFIIRALYGENFSYTTTPYFTDVPSTNTFFKYVQKFKDEGITAVSGTYSVDSYVTRGQMAAFIIRAKFGEDFSYTQTPYFTDVPSTHTFFKYVQKLKDERITTTTGTYGVDDIVTRAQMAAFLSRAFLGMQ